MEMESSFPTVVAPGAILVESTSSSMEEISILLLDKLIVVDHEIKKMIVHAAKRLVNTTAAAI